MYAIGRTSSAGRAETSLPACGGAKLINCCDFDPKDRRDHELSDPVAATDNKWLGSMIDEDHHQLATIVRIDRAGAVEKGHAVLCGEAGARPDLRLVAMRQFKGKTGGDECAGAGQELDRGSF